jgi:protein SCO1/2
MITPRTLLLWFACCLAAPSSAATTPGGDFTLHTPRGEAVSLTSLRGRVVLLYFGFTYCPEMCPTELLRFQRLLSLLPADKRTQVQPIFVSVDPKRDTPDVLVPYVSHFGQDILALTGSEQELRQVAEQYGAQFRYVPTGSSYTVDHTANTFLIDRTGTLVQIIPYGTPTKEILKLVSRLLP